MKKPIIYILILLGFLSQCKQKHAGHDTVPLGTWRAVLHTQGQEIPFALISKKDDENQTVFIIKNREEEILLDSFRIADDSLILPMHIFDTKIVAHLSENEMNGYWTKNYVDDYFIKFRAEYDRDERFVEIDDPIDYNFSGKWAVRFFNERVNYPAIGEFQQVGNRITGTFLKETGDYRYLEGIVTREGFKLSSFDGENAYLFEARLQGNDSLAGEFWSGKTGHYQWKARRNENFSLRDADSLTTAKTEEVSLSFPNENGEIVSLDQEKFKDKVLIIQILGSWCPNCMDETAFLTEWYEKNKDRGVEIVGLAFERKDEFEYGSQRIKKLKERYDIGYEVLFVGKNDADTRSNALPMISRIISFPTTIFVGKDRKIQKIHTGFSGPGTGAHYEEFVRDFNQTVDRLLAAQTQ